MLPEEWPRPAPAHRLWHLENDVIATALPPAEVDLARPHRDLVRVLQGQGRVAELLVVVVLALHTRDLDRFRGAVGDLARVGQGHLGQAGLGEGDLKFRDENRIRFI